MMFYQEQWDYYPHQCLSPEELNYYVSKFDFIVSKFRPSNPTNLTMARSAFTATFTPSSWQLRLHLYDISYGLFVSTPPNE